MKSNSHAGYTITPPKGTLVISLDFELAWGAENDKVDAFRQTSLEARRAVPAILAIFAEYRIHATWAAVGMLFCETKEELLDVLPAIRPAYRNSGVSAYERLERLGTNEEEDPIHFAPSLVRQIASSPGQEIGTHTFSHYNCLEPGQDVTAFEADLRAAHAVARRRGLELKSIVFPKNQIRKDYLTVSRSQGLIAYRGNPPSLYGTNGSALKVMLRRGLRLADAYVRLSGNNAWAPEHPEAAAIVDVPASRFLRPWNRPLKHLEALRLRRILSGLDYAAVHRRCYHLWWHPHNFGCNLDRNLDFLKSVLDRLSHLREAYGMQSLGMAEFARRRQGFSM